MHEFALIDNIIKICEETAQTHGLSKIIAVQICIGKMRQVVPETMQFAFCIAAKETRCEAAKLEMDFLPIRLLCKECQHEFPVEDKLFQCPSCKSGALRVIQGQELFIKSIEGE
jgi:hydrogenase nickel incorporation protein HypA/HybF